MAVAQTPIDGDLSHRLAGLFGNPRQNSMGIAIEDKRQPARKWAVGNDSDVVLSAILQQPVLNGTIHQVVANLIGNNPMFLHGALSPFQFGYIEIADADKANLSIVNQIFNSPERLFDWYGVADRFAAAADLRRLP